MGTKIMFDIQKQNMNKKVKTLCAFGAIILHVFLIGSLWVSSIMADSRTIEPQVTKLPLILIELPKDKPTVKPVVIKIKNGGGKKGSSVIIPQRTVAVAKISQSTEIPKTISVKPNNVPEIPYGAYKIGKVNTEGASNVGAAPNESEFKGISTNVPVKVVETETPPTPPKKKAVIVSKGVINGRAKYLAKPTVTEFLKKITQSGTQISVSVVVDEQGRVTSAKASNGHPLLMSVCENAAMASKFEPTLLSGSPVRIQGTIIYRFVF